MVRHCTCGLYFTRRWLVKYKSPLVQYLTILHSTPCNDILVPYCELFKLLSAKNEHRKLLKSRIVTVNTVYSKLVRQHANGI